ncbi:MAG: hypothetical protein GX893_02700 [Firmicutes bacterium]|nr:hypothetical protein [Bacillota bacterium]
MTNIVPTSANVQTTTSSTVKKTGAAQELGKDAFLQLLVTQLRYQDPLNPQDNSAFIAQMAQFSALEQMQNLNATMKQLLQLQASMQTIAPAYLGLQVTINAEDGEIVKGIVSAVKFIDQQPWLVVNGEEYPVSQVIELTQGVKEDES